jgi:hypothetical protein
VLKPFADESAVLEIGGLTAENRVDRLSLHGALDLTRDKAGLNNALALKALVDEIVKALQSETLPDEITRAPTDKVANPFS